MRIKSYINHEKARKFQISQIKNGHTTTPLNTQADGAALLKGNIYM